LLLTFGEIAWWLSVKGYPGRFSIPFKLKKNIIESIKKSGFNKIILHILPANGNRDWML
jgi:hypothetical protein